ncbi:MAG: YfhO family protein [Deltaproteobacteria bacterium]|nr:YfhO family protein [Deltaproteobacteria bacterium]
MGKKRKDKGRGKQAEPREAGAPLASGARGRRLAIFARENADLVAAAATALAFVLPLFATSELFLGSGTDMVSNEYPLHVFATSWIAKGVLPLWNPYILGGIPFQAGIHGYLYPGWWTGIVLPAGFDIKLGILLHLALAAVGGAWFARGRVRSRLASYVAGSAFALSGFMFLHLFAGHRVMIATAAYLPWIAGCVDRALRGSRKHLLPGAALAGLMVLCGHYHVVFIGTAGLLLYFILDALLGEMGGTGGKARARGAATAFGFMVSVMAAGAVLAAVQVLPMLDTIGLTQRAERSLEYNASYSSAPANLLTYLLPNLFGNNVDALFLGDWSYWEALGYLGLAPLALAILGVAVLPWRRVVPAVAVALAGLVLALGAHTPVFGLYLDVIPGADLFRSPGRFCLLVTLFCSLLAAQALDAWLAGGIPRGRRVAAWIAVALPALAGLAAAAVLGSASSSDFQGWLAGVCDRGKVAVMTDQSWAALLALVRTDATKAAATLCVGAIVLTLGMHRPSWLRVLGPALVTLLVLDLHGFGRRFLKTAPESRFALPAGVVDLAREQGGVAARFLTPPETRWMNYGAMHGIGNPAGYDSFIDDRYARYLNRSQGRAKDTFFVIERLRKGSPLIRHLGVSTLVSLGPLVAGRNRIVTGYDWFAPWKRAGETYVYRDEKAEPRVALVHRTEVVADEDAAYSRMESPGFDIRETVLLESRPTAGFDAPEPAPKGATETAEIVLYEPNRVGIRAEAASRAVLVLSDVLLPGWTATVDGRQAPMVHANRVMRGVPVPPGRHTIEMRYLPGSFVAGSVVSAISIAALGLVAAIARRRSRRRA